MRLVKPSKTYSFTGNASKQKHFNSGFRKHDLALQVCLILKIEINHIHYIFSDFLVKYFIFRTLTSYSRDSDMQILLRQAAAQICSSELYSICFAAWDQEVHAYMLYFKFSGSFPLRSYLSEAIQNFTYEHLLSSCTEVGTLYSVQRVPHAEVNWIRKAFY